MQRVGLRDWSALAGVVAQVRIAADEDAELAGREWYVRLIGKWVALLRDEPQCVLSETHLPNGTEKSPFFHHCNCSTDAKPSSLQAWPAVSTCYQLPSPLFIFPS